eukprot:Skav212515  [mRNA]  locus=scaffold2713:300851:305211:+ [translate_table: standard]
MCDTVAPPLTSIASRPPAAVSAKLVAFRSNAAQLTLTRSAMSLLFMWILTVATTVSSEEGLVVRLQRVPGNGTHFYVGRLSVGEPKQTFSVLFDTASGHVLLRHGTCKSPACHKHKRFFPWKSSSAVDVNSDGLPVQKDHHVAQGAVRRDAVSLEFSQADLGDGLAEAVLVKAGKRRGRCHGADVSLPDGDPFTRRIAVMFQHGNPGSSMEFDLEFDLCWKCVDLFLRSVDLRSPDPAHWFDRTRCVWATISTTSVQRLTCLGLRDVEGQR